MKKKNKKKLRKVVLICANELKDSLGIRKKSLENVL